jgi:hypothetical protein
MSIGGHFKKCKMKYNFEFNFDDHYDLVCQDIGKCHFLTHTAADSIFLQGLTNFSVSDEPIKDPTLILELTDTSDDFYEYKDGHGRIYSFCKEDFSMYFEAGTKKLYVKTLEDEDSIN